ncbi:MAG: SDR family oxidoreductase [Silicimonas sp.]|nr:SDR family oxidoreductase [Silicimonas sp.]
MSAFEGQRVLITGAASGFGKALAQALSAQGARLVLGDIDAERLETVATALPCPAHSQRCDVSREADQAALAALAREALGGLDIAVNNAGVTTGFKSLLETTEAEMDRNFAINAKGVFFGMKHQIPLMLESGGQILNVASSAGVGGAPKLAAYCAAKHAVVGMTKTAAFEFARKNIRVNAICPFYSTTPMVTEMADDAMQGFLASASPMGRLGETGEVVAAMLGILNPANSYMTGQAISVDGGVSAV